jgi:hypothetical protein
MIVQLESSCKFVMNFLVPKNAGKLSSGCTAGGLSNCPQLQSVNFLVLLEDVPLAVTLRALFGVTKRTTRRYKAMSGREGSRKVE